MATRKEVTVRYEEQQCTLLLVEGAEPEALSSALFAKLGIQGMSPYLTEVGSDAVVPLTAALPAGMILEAHARHTLRPPKQRLPRQRLGTVSIDESRARTRSRLDSGGTDDADADLQRRADSPSKGWTSAAAGGAADRGPETRSRTGTFSSPSQIPSPSKRPGDPGAATAPLLAPSSASPPPPPRLNQACEHDVAAEVFQPGRRPVVPGQEGEAGVRSQSMPTLDPPLLPLAHRGSKISEEASEQTVHAKYRGRRYSMRRVSHAVSPEDLEGLREDDIEDAIEDVAEAAEHIEEAAEKMEHATEAMADSVDRFARLSADLANERTLLAWTRTCLAAVRTVFAFLAVTAMDPLGHFSVVSTTWACVMVMLISAILGFRRYQVIKECLLSKQPLKDQKGFGRGSNKWVIGFVVWVAIGTACGIVTKAWVKG